MKDVVPDRADRPVPDLARVFVTIGFKEWVGAAPHKAWLGQFDIPEDQLVDLRGPVEEIVRGAVSDFGLPSFMVQESRGQTEWGASSGEVIRLVLWVGETGAAALVGAGALRFLQKLGALDWNKSNQTGMSRDEAVSRSRWIVTSHYAVDACTVDPLPDVDSELVPVSEVHDADVESWTIRLRDRNDVEYSIRFGHVDGLPTVVELGRFAPREQGDTRREPSRMVS